MLLASGRGAAMMPGEFRRSQNWIGGSRPGNAAFVPPPPNHVQDDVVGAVERRVEFVEAVTNGEAVTREQVEATEWDTGLMLFFAMLTYAFTLGTTVFAFVMPGGLVANERKSTAIMLWAQHPMPLTSFYLQRYAGIQVATVAALLIFDFTASLASLPSEVSVPEWEGVPSNCLLGVLACAVSFGISSLGIRRGAFFGLVYYLASILLGQLIANAPPGTSSDGLGEFVITVLPFLILPIQGTSDLVAGIGSGAAWPWGATGMVVYHFALWTAVAWLGLRRIEGRPLKL